MRLLFIVLFLSVVILLWAAMSVARHIRRHTAERHSALAEPGNEKDQQNLDKTGTDPISGQYEGE